MLLLALALTAFAQDAEPGTLENPLLCDGVDGERWYLSRLRTADGQKLRWVRRGSFGGNRKDEHLLDGYTHGEGTVFLDMYHPMVVEIRAPKGYRLLTEWSERFEYVSGKIHALKEDAPFTGDIREEREKYTLALTVKDGAIQGALTQTYPGGAVRRKAEYGTDNRLHGKESWFREDGKPWAVYHYEHGVPHGAFELYDEEGNLTSSGEYERGQAKDGSR